MWLSIRSGDTAAFQTSTQDFRSRASNCVLMTITVIAVCVLVACGVVIVREYALSKDYMPADCRVTNVTYSDPMICVFCSTKGKSKDKGATCTESEFPCVHVHVTYRVNGKGRTGFLHPDSLQAASKYSQCSYSVCLKKPQENKDAVSKYATQWLDTKEKAFKCFYSTVDNKRIITQKKYTTIQVIHSMVWPSVVILICGVIFLRLETQRRGVGFCSGKLPDEQAGRVRGSASIEDHSVKDSLVQVQTTGHRHHHHHHHHPDTSKVECKIVHKKHRDPKPPPGLSNSMSSLDCVAKGDQVLPVLSNNGKLGASASAEGLRYHQVNQSEGSPAGRATLNGAAKYRQDSNKTDSSFGSQGSRVTGQETPV